MVKQAKTRIKRQKDKQKLVVYILTNIYTNKITKRITPVDNIFCKNGSTNGALPPHYVSLPLKHSYAVFYDEG